MRRVNGKLDGRRAIKQYLQERNDWPLHDYFSAREVDPNLKIWPSGSVREKIQFMEPDDDVHYSLVGLARSSSSVPNSPGRTSGNTGSRTSPSPASVRPRRRPSRT